MFEHLDERKRIAAPKSIPVEEWQNAEIKRGATFPEYIIPLRARPKTPEQQALYVELKEKSAELAKFLFDAYPLPFSLADDHLTDIAIRMQPEFFDLAIRARSLADSHRKFNVGGVLVGLRKCGPGENPWVVLFDANTRQETREPIRKHCAELHLCDRVDPKLPEMGLPEEEIVKGVALYVAGLPKVDDDSNKKQVAICCCKLCRDRLWKMTLRKNGKEPIMSPTMPVFTVNPSNRILKKMLPIRTLHGWHNEVPPEYEEVD